jgi:UDP-2,4-diacetamido-2,4,6-trideoxy-beta-L-altropyranose hydrolase
MGNALAVFRVDASPGMGIGHVMRCLTLADALQALGFRCRFVSTVETINMVPSLTASGHPLSPLWPVEMADPSALARALPGGADVLVVDHYGLDARYESALRPVARVIVAIDDLADRQRDCDVLLDQTLDRSADDYRFLIPAPCRVLVGTRYALLRPQFVEARRSAEARRARGHGLGRLLVGLGGTDSLNATEWALGAIQASGLGCTVDVVMGPGSPHLERVRARIARTPGAVLHVGVDNMAALMLQADLAIGAAGTSSWERCCLGLPTLLLILADNQRPTARALVKAGAAELVGEMPGADPSVLSAALARLSGDPAGLRRMSEAAATLCDGDGAARVAAIIAAEVAGR